VRANFFVFRIGVQGIEIDILGQILVRRVTVLTGGMVPAISRGDLLSSGRAI
jgi:hypothetical protein